MRSIQDPEGRGRGERGSGRPSLGRQGVYLRYTGLGIQMLMTILLGLWGGMKLDERLDADPVWTVVGCLAGIGLAMAVVIRETGARRP